MEGSSFLRQDLKRMAVDTKGLIVFHFSAVNRGVGCSIHHEMGFEVTDALHHAVRVCKVQFWMSTSTYCENGSQWSQCPLELKGHLSLITNNEYFHGFQGTS
jgi:hypothetical protein